MEGNESILAMGFRIGMGEPRELHSNQTNENTLAYCSPQTVNVYIAKRKSYSIHTPPPSIMHQTCSFVSFSSTSSHRHFDKRRPGFDPAWSPRKSLAFSESGSINTIM
jgi:hypothetical protein